MSEKRETITRVLTTVDEKREFIEAAERAALPVAVWARQALLLKAREDAKQTG